MNYSRTSFSKTVIHNIQKYFYFNYNLNAEGKSIINNFFLTIHTAGVVLS